MDAPQFWTELQPLVKQLPNLPPDFWESLRTQPTLPVQLIQETVCQGPVYLRAEPPLHLAAVDSDVTLSASQQLALKLCLANSPLVVVQGSPGSGKTRIAKMLVQAAISQQKRGLLLTHSQTALRAYENLPGIPFQLAQTHDYRSWLARELRYRHLGKLPMDFLPVHLLPDELMVQLRSPRKLEWLLSIVQDPSQSQKIHSLLQTEFPQWSTARIQLLVYRLQQLTPLLEQQLWLTQQSEQLSEEAVATLADLLTGEPQMWLMGTVSELLQPQHQSFWQTSFDWVIVEEAESLSWGELVCLAGITQKLVLLGSLSSTPIVSRLPFKPHPAFFWLGEFLLPAYCPFITEQFRLHSDIATPVFDMLYGCWIRSQSQASSLTLPHFPARLQWQDVRAQPEQQRNLWEGNRLLKFLSQFLPQQALNIGILAFTEAQRDWLLANSPSGFRDVLIGTIAEWVGQERQILLVSCVGYPELLQSKDLEIVLTRGSDS